MGEAPARLSLQPGGIGTASVAVHSSFTGGPCRSDVGRTSPYAPSRLDGLPLNFNGRLLVQLGRTENSYMRVLSQAVHGRVRMWRGGLRSSLSVAAPFVWRCLNSHTITPFPHPPHRTGHADFPHPALGQELTPAHTKGHPQFTRSTARGRVSPAYTDRALGGQPPMPPPGWSFASRNSAGFFLRFSMWRLPQRSHIAGVF